MLHQILALEWMTNNEDDDKMKYRGGILADDMGLGKTMEIIALILQQRLRDERKRTEVTKRRRELEQKSISFSGSSAGSSSSSSSSGVSTRASSSSSILPVALGGTLIVCVPSLVGHWQDEFEKYVGEVDTVEEEELEKEKRGAKKKTFKRRPFNVLVFHEWRDEVVVCFGHFQAIGEDRLGSFPFRLQGTLPNG
jgi:SNF2 family DNA or RNA helicase